MARKAFNNPEATGTLSKGVSKLHVPATPALETFGKHSETSQGAQEDDEEGPGDAT
jgi:hypothetical protein